MYILDSTGEHFMELVIEAAGMECGFLRQSIISMVVTFRCCRFAQFGNFSFMHVFLEIAKVRGLFRG